MQSAEIRNNDKKHLASLLAVKKLGGDIDMAILQAKAGMDKEDAKEVMEEFNKAND